MSGLMVQGPAIFRNISKNTLKIQKKSENKKIYIYIYLHSYISGLMVKGPAIFGNIQINQITIRKK